MNEYILAYKDKNGNDCHGNPWLLKYDSKDELYDDIIENNEDIGEYIVFSINSDKLPEVVTWEFANKHKID